MTVLYFADLSDPTLNTVAVDLNALPGSLTGFQLRDVDWGSIDTQATWQEESTVAGAEQVRRRHGVVTATFRLHYEFGDGGTYDDLLAATRLLGQYLDSYGVLVWQPEDSAGNPLTADPVYIDTYPSPVAALFRGQPRGGIHVLGQLLDPEGYTFEVWRHPYPRRAAETVVSAAAIDGSIGGNVVTFTNTGSALSEGRLTVEVPGSEDAVQMRVGLRSGDVTEFAASFTNYAITSPATVTDYWKEIDSKTLTPSDPAVLAGTYRVLAQVELADDIFTLQCRWGNSSVTPQANSNEQVELDAEEVDSYDLVEVDLGLVTFYPDSPSLTIEIWAKSESGVDAGAWGNVTLIPSDELSIIASAPGFRAGHYGLERWDGSELALTGSLDVSDDGAVFLTELNDAVETKPTAGRTLPVGRHVLEFRGNVRNKDKTRSKRGELQVLKNAVLEGRSVIRARKGRIITRYNQDDRRRVSFDVTGADGYRFRVLHTEAEVVGRRIRVNRLRHWFIPVVTAGRRFVLDALQQDSRVESTDSERVFSLPTTALPYLAPGDGALVFSITTLAANGHDGVDLREPLPKAESVVAAVTLEITPRELHP